MTPKLIRFKGAVYRLAKPSVELVLYELLTTFMESGKYRLICDINKGDCRDFAEEAESTLRALGYDADLMHSDDLVDNVIRKTYKLTFDDDVNVFDDAFSKLLIPVHLWVEVDGKAYDAEAIDGRDHWYELPLYRRFFRKRLRLKKMYGVP